MKNKKVIIGVICAIVIIAISIGIFIIINFERAKPEDTVYTYISYINEQNYDGMYDCLSSNSKEEFSKEDFVTKNKNIYEGIDALNVNIQINEIKKENSKIKIDYYQTMNTSAGKVEFSNTMWLVKDEKSYKINWSTTLIFPELKTGYKVRVKTLKGNRGAIFDKNGEKLAYDGVISSVGIVPGKLGEQKEEQITKIAGLLGISEDFINNQITASYVKDDTFVPIKKVSKNDTKLKQELLEIPGIKITDTDGRVYTLGEEAAHLIGYVQSINAEELKEKEQEGYTSHSIIGKSGLEAAYEERLRAKDGIQIYIEDENGNLIKEIARQEQENGEDIKLTIDSNIQKQLYDTLKNDKGLFVVMQPQTGELLALVSTPSYNSNDFTLGMTNSKWQELNNDENKPLYNRFVQSYCPGSTFKPITGAIGLTTGKLTTDETFNYSGKAWQKDSSWGDYQITTLTAYNGPKNLLNAIIHSDNIYFAQAALKIGSNEFCNGLDILGFNEQIDFPLTLKKSTYASTDKIETEGKLANSGYGQGDILVNPIHMASIYSSFANQGNMIKPYIEYKQNKQVEYFKENAISKEAAEVIKQDLIQVVENPEGTANDMKINGITIAGKTGTAELKTSREDTESGTLGWFDCFTINNQSGNDMLVISMVENVQNNSDGGSHYLIKKIRTLLQTEM